MISKLHIKNYKSVQDLELELGRFNIFIGENGCGKSNILEAIGLGAAAASDKLDNEFLISRGIRVSESQFMRSAFKKSNLLKDIELNFLIDNSEHHWVLSNDNKPYSKWKKKNVSEEFDSFAKQFLEYLFEGVQPKGFNIDDAPNELKNTFDSIRNLLIEDDDTSTKKALKGFVKDGLKTAILHEITQFIIYSPENTSLRTFEKEGQIEPLGINGEGLFRLLKTLGEDKKQTKLNEIRNHLRLIGWFDNFEIPENLFTGEKYLKIKDKYIDPKAEAFDQQNANEGFLFLLFYFTLMISEETPKFFAIDNIEASLNPKLCSKLTNTLNNLAVQYNKQVILTTHNPSVLDGMDLNDDNQRLFVIYRNKLGHTKCTRVLRPQVKEGEDPVKLSEAFMRGYIGGLPKNF